MKIHEQFKDAIAGNCKGSKNCQCELVIRVTKRSFLNSIDSMIAWHYVEKNKHESYSDSLVEHANTIRYLLDQKQLITNEE